ncbi:hypothetical protein [Amycolatopsis thermophila]|uniref:Uncharacterized protein n=1 Tax=Amycolatopsis thermophila TaxID=206084 RepID=A0ABU0ELJ8_9PSEU|nr:hypothetical protein [Amycolatopsis thermophila]MDQ0376152.1 hypothetical protein [Amycolatopsis thermophila]
MDNVAGADDASASSPTLGMAKADAKYEGCDLSAAPDGAAITGAEYHTDDYDDAPVGWTK